MVVLWLFLCNVSGFQLMGVWSNPSNPPWLQASLEYCWPHVLCLQFPVLYLYNHYRKFYSSILFWTPRTLLELLWIFSTTALQFVLSRRLWLCKRLGIFKHLCSVSSESMVLYKSCIIIIIIIITFWFWLKLLLSRTLCVCVCLCIYFSVIFHCKITVIMLPYTKLKYCPYKMS